MLAKRTAGPYLLAVFHSWKHILSSKIFSRLLLRYIDCKLKFFVISTEALKEKHADFHI